MSQKFKVGIVLQARISSTRLPGKVLLPFYNNQNILDLVLTRLTTEVPGFPVILATTDQKVDDPLAQHVAAKGIPVFRGDENNVLKRFVDAAHAHSLDGVLRVCSDNPFLFGDYVRDLLEKIAAEDFKLDYLSYRDQAGTPSIKTHWGLFAEYVSVHALEKALSVTTEPLYLEHVTNFIYGNPGMFKVKLLAAPTEIVNRTDLRFTIDTETDFNANQTLFQTLAANNSGISLKDLILEVDRHPEIKGLMQQGINNFKK